MATHSSTLTWKIPRMQEPGRLQSMGLLRVGHDWASSLSLFTFMHWRRKWQPTPVFLTGESQGRGSLVNCHLWGCTESDKTEAIYQQQQQKINNRTNFSSVQSLSRVRLFVTPWSAAHQLPEFTQTRVHRVGDAIQPSQPLLSRSPPAPNPSQHQSHQNNLFISKSTD